MINNINKIIKTNIIDISAFLILCFCCFYITDRSFIHFTWPPVYYFCCSGIFSGILYCFLKGKITIKLWYNWVIILFFICLIPVFYLPVTWFKDIKLLLFCLFIFYISLILFNMVSVDMMLKFSKLSALLTVILLIVEVIIRFLKIDINNILVNYYLFKFDTILGIDTNFVGLIISITYGFCEYVFYKSKTKDVFIFKIILLILGMLSFSKATIATLFFMLIIFRYKKMIIKGNFVSYLMVTFFTMLMFLLLTYCFPEVYGGRALIAKELFNKFIEQDVERILYGVSVGNSLKISGVKYGHNIISVLLIELGIIGSLSWLSLFGLTVVKSKGYSLFILLPYFINGLGYICFAMPYFWVYMSVICCIENRKARINLKLIRS